MLGRYRRDESLSLTRIVDEVQAVAVVVAAALIIAFAPPRLMLWLLPAEFVVLSLSIQFGLPRLFLRVAPPELVRRLPTPDGPHGYVDLIRMWRHPEWHCSHAGFTGSAPQSRLIGYVVEIFAIAAALGAIDALMLHRLTHATPAIAGAAVVAIAIQCFLAVRFRRYVAAANFSSPRTSEIVIVLLVAVIATIAITAIALRFDTLAS